MLEIEPGASTGGRRAKRSQPAEPLDKRSSSEPHASGDGEKITKSQTRRPRYRVAFGLAGIAIAATALWLIIGSFGSHQLDPLVALVRDRISPPVDSTAASVKFPARAATALPPAITQTSPSPDTPTGPSPVAPTGPSPIAPAGGSPVMPTAPSPVAATSLSPVTPMSPSPVVATSLSPGVTAERDTAAERAAPLITPRPTAPARSSLQSPSSEPPTSSPPVPPQPAGPGLSAAETAALVARGDAFVSAGDFTSARSFFERAADAGDSQAAMRMAVTFDAAFLDRVGLHGVRGDPKQAAFWYQRARDLSGAEPDQRSPEKAPSGAPSTH